MYKVLIADDEPWVAYGISRLIDWTSEGFEVIGEVYDGASALAQVREARPDVVISDIRMPGLDGIELLEEIRKLGSGTQVVLVSGYSEFEYAQRALRLGAFDYLLKQIDKEQLRETMARLRERLDDKRQASSWVDQQLGELFELLNSDSDTEIGRFYACRETSEYPNYRVVSVHYEQPADIGDMKEIRGMGSLSGFAMRTGQQRWTLLLNYDETEPADLLELIEKRLGSASHIGISTLGRASDSLSRLYREADTALFTSLLYPGLRVARYRANEPLAGASAHLLRLELAIREQATDRIKEIVREIEQECLRQQPNAEQVTSVYNQIVALLHKYYGQDEAFPDPEFMSYSQLGRLGDPADSIFERVRTAFDRQAEPDFPIVREQVKSVMSFIDIHFTDDLSLGVIAKRLNLSLGYLSFLIKKETGRTYSEYVSFKRIALAKELLANEALSIHEIVERVGYKDYFHFNKLFKKHVGVTPSKYRKL
ncbi:response regulator transcription factor [Cohnella fermenti]|uniref:Response regulator n=1 Tax=Cohnella fermenti TaxID=2565925 RepID=A0A4S4BRF3_9BACL|nr:response regulator [Cohnella fermenti]THF75235.1 response regulator [Cohnella fermenti]